jgi:predicted AAA+ superfamily ATPase
MENTIIKHNSHWEKSYENIYRRDILDNLTKKIHLKQIQVLKGIRRSGKTTVFKLLINYLVQSGIDSKSILYINLDDPYFTELYSSSRHLYKLLELSEKLTSTKIKYLFLDEIQNVSHWEKFVKSIYDNEVVTKIFVTGSNSSLLDGEYATLLSGRYIQDEIRTPSFKELLEYKGIKSRFDLIKNKIDVLNLCDDMMQYGSFYEVVKEQEFKRDLILSYYDTIIFKDCIANHTIRDTKTFKEVANFAITNASNLYSYNSISKAIGVNDNTIKNYIHILEDSYIIKEIHQYSYKLKEQIKTKKKVYLNENSFLAQTSFRFSEDFGKLFENLVYTELMKQNYKVYFYNKDFECDFIAIKDDKTIAFRVCYTLTAQNRQRELEGLQKLPIQCDEKYVITYNGELEDENGIVIIAFWDYFFEGYDR